ncbi:MAG: flagellar motor protein MotB, partial [Firmicutes bacterium]|nr:flagellar motor protein MotB [Bacillota bacterium]
MRRRRKKSTNQVGSPLWMTTYADMVSLLLCTFVLLYDISSVDRGKFEGLKSSIHCGFGILDRGPVISEDPDIF